eukprot:COSAG04_NODE_1826_length_5485_cov_2.733569_5_plen_51_part_00
MRTMLAALTLLITAAVTDAWWKDRASPPSSARAVVGAAFVDLFPAPVSLC